MFYRLSALSCYATFSDLYVSVIHLSSLGLDEFLSNYSSVRPYIYHILFNCIFLMTDTKIT